MRAMTHQTPEFHVPSPTDAGRQIAQLSHALMLVRQMAGREVPGEGDAAALDEGARIGAAYGDAAPVVQRRFDALVAETALWAAAGVEALLAADDADTRPRAAAARLADELAKALRDLSRLLGL